MKNSADLKVELSNLFANVRDKKVDNETANTLVKVSNSLMRVVSVEMQQAKELNDKNPNPFLVHKK